MVGQGLQPLPTPSTGLGPLPPSTVPSSPTFLCYFKRSEGFQLGLWKCRETTGIQILEGSPALGLPEVY